MLVGVQRGQSVCARGTARTAAKWRGHLLGATVIAILAFAPIGLSKDATGEFAGSLFWVLLLSLGLSWFTQGGGLNAGSRFWVTEPVPQRHQNSSKRCRVVPVIGFIAATAV